MVYRGWIEGDRLVFESMGDAPVRLRFTWETASEGVINWKNEMALGDGEWFLIEEYPMTLVEGEPSLHEGPDETRSELKGAP
jgi:hypothetical protein